jgi:hypothetical protein
MSKVSYLHKKWSCDPDYRAACGRTWSGVRAGSSLVEARIRAGLTQAQLEKRMKTTPSVVARPESVRPSTKTLEKVACRSQTPGSRSASRPAETQPDSRWHLMVSIVSLTVRRSSSQCLPPPLNNSTRYSHASSSVP